MKNVAADGVTVEKGNVVPLRREAKPAPSELPDGFRPLSPAEFAARMPGAQSGEFGETLARIDGREPVFCAECRAVHAPGNVARCRHVVEQRIVEGVAAKLGQAAPPKSLVGVPTAAAFAKRWTSGLLHKEYPDYVKDIGQDDNRERLARLFATKVDGPYATVGDVPLAEGVFTVEIALAAMATLPAEMKRATRAHHARALNRLVNLAVYPARILKASPLPRGFVPSAGKPPARAWWMPTDDGELCGCTDVPLLFRLFYGFAFREGPRESEAAALNWRDVRGKSLTLDENKTDDPRAWALYPGTPEALAAWRGIVKAAGLPTGDDDPVFVHLSGQHKGTRIYVKRMAEDFRDHVRKALLWRPDFAMGKNRKQLDFHDLRGGFVSWALATGRTEAWVTDRTGHTNSVMLYRYKRRVRHAGELGVQPPSSLLEAIPELREAAQRSGSKNAADGRKNADPLRSNAEVAEWQTQRTQNPPPERA